MRVCTTVRSILFYVTSHLTSDEPQAAVALIAVDFPAPLAPITATRLTCDTVRLTSMMVGLSWRGRWWAGGIAVLPQCLESPWWGR